MYIDSLCPKSAASLTSFRPTTITFIEVGKRTDEVLVGLARDGVNP